MKIAGLRHKTSTESRFWCMLDISDSKPQSATRKGTCRISQWKRCIRKLAYDFCRVFQQPFACMNHPEVKQLCTRLKKIISTRNFLGARDWTYTYHRFRWYATLQKKKTTTETFPKFSYVFSTDRIEIHQSQPLVWPSDLIYVILAGCDWWISIRYVDNT